MPPRWSPVHNVLSMSGQAKRAGGCWTCRLRRKKCDAVRPVCGECRALGIACHNQDAKPPWMDGGVRQADMRERVKAEIKRLAARRRGRQQMQSLTEGEDVETTFVDVIHTTIAAQPTTTSLPSVPPRPQRSATLYDTGPHSSSDLENSLTTGSTTSTYTPTGTHETPLSSRQGTSSPPPSRGDEETQFWLMTYLDFVIPALFPFYKPRLLDGGRAWMLVLLAKNRTLHHIALSLSSYLFSVELAAEQSVHSTCKALGWEKLQQQMQAAFYTLDQSLQQSFCEGMEHNLIHHVGLMESIIQLLNVQVVMTQCEDWQVHLDAAMRLFERIFQDHGMVDGYPQLPLLLEKTGRCTWKLDAPRPPETPIRTAEQSSLLFFTSLVLVYDILGSTSTGQAPRLQAYHPALLGQNPGPPPTPKSSVTLAEVIGCENWVMILIGETAALHAWKNQCKSECRLSLMELAEKAHCIEGRLRQGIDRLEEAISPTNLSSTNKLNGIIHAHNPPRWGTETQLVTLIWAYATHAYLHVTVSGWQVHNANLRQIVVRSIQLLTMLPTPAGLRALVWPFCLTGCLATAAEEQIFRDLAAASKLMQGVGGLRIALNLLEKVWLQRVEANAMDWDLSVCLGVLGYPAFLV